MSYLEQFDATPDADKLRLVRQWMDSEPLPFFKELREQRPVLVTPGAILLARFDDVTEVLNQPKLFTVALYLPKMGNGIYLMAHDDDALHTREKSIMQGLLNRDDLPRVRALVARLANEILDKAPGKKLEVAYDYSRSIPAGLVQEYFGFSGVERKDLIEWSYWNQYDTFHNQPFDIIADELRDHISTRHTETGEKLNKYILELIAHRLITVKGTGLWHWLRTTFNKLIGNKEAANDDIVARMLRSSFPAEVDFDIQRLGVNAGGLLIGAIETTAQCVTQVIQYLVDSPEWFAKAQAAARLPDPREFDGIVWEALRFVPLAPYLFRQAASEYTLGQGTAYATRIPAGSYVLPLTQSAMFDPRAFENPDQFIPSRNWYHYFHFGFGAHECLGKYIGMVMIPEMVRQILLRPGLKASAPIDYKGGPFPEVYELSWS
ncbi:cytochrome P450 [Uliginosibacterium sediminicola]|uniref:Cytochrome P450 n=1 Tax=Uliginosibacterium sediminicola TaxID=2024550 RepID=A0ABU9YT91_9RHOO